MERRKDRGGRIGREGCGEYLDLMYVLLEFGFRFAWFWRCVCVGLLDRDGHGDGEWAICEGCIAETDNECRADLMAVYAFGLSLVQ